MIKPKEFNIFNIKIKAESTKESEPKNKSLEKKNIKELRSAYDISKVDEKNKDKEKMSRNIFSMKEIDINRNKEIDKKEEKGKKKYYRKRKNNKNRNGKIGEGNERKRKERKRNKIKKRKR